MRLKSGPNFFSKLHHPAIGIRIPEIFLPGIVAGLNRKNCAAGLMLSFGRETATEEIINAPPNKYQVTLGHTGTSIANYQNAAYKTAIKAGIPIEIEADHLIVIGSQEEQAVTRITGVHTAKTIAKKMLQKSIAYIFQEIKEAVKLGYTRCFTLDTSDLFDDEVMSCSKSNLKKKIAEKFSLHDQKRLINNYKGKEFSFSLKGEKIFKIKFDEELIMKLALRYQTSLEVSNTIYQRILKDFHLPFGFEISFDETKDLTRLEDALFYLLEWREMGNHFDYFAPNIGFGKRADYHGSHSILQKQVSYLTAIVSFFDDALLSIHSGSGSTPYSGKGEGVYETLLSATRGRLKYKISGVYYELLLEILASYTHGSKARDLFENIFDAVANYCQKEIKNDGPLATQLLKEQVKKYHEDIKKGSELRYNPRADFFRFHSYLALNFRNEKGDRPFRDELIQIYRENREFHKKIDYEVQILTESLIEGLKFAYNY